MAAASEKSAMLWTEGLGVTYPGAVLALKPTAIGFERGQFTVLLGLSGAGKSTLLRTLNHLVRPSVGRVISAEFGDLAMGRNLRQHRRKSAMVFQHHQLIERHSALENVMMGRLAYHSTWRSLFPLPRGDLELAMHCLERVGLADKALTRVDQLSGGQQQRVGIARALAQQPSLILADEPVASLDPATSERVLTLLRDICREDGIAAVVSLHQLEYARSFADRIIGLADAEIVFDAAPAALTEAEISRIYRGAPAPANPELRSAGMAERTTADRSTTPTLEIAQ